MTEVPLILAAVALIGAFRMWRQGRMELAASRSLFAEACEQMEAANATTKDAALAIQQLKEGAALISYCAVDEAVELLEASGFRVNDTRPLKKRD